MQTQEIIRPDPDDELIVRAVTVTNYEVASRLQQLVGTDFEMLDVHVGKSVVGFRCKPADKVEAMTLLERMYHDYLRANAPELVEQERR